MSFDFSNKRYPDEPITTSQHSTFECFPDDSCVKFEPITISQHFNGTLRSNFRMRGAWDGFGTDRNLKRIPGWDFLFSGKNSCCLLFVILSWLKCKELGGQSVIHFMIRDAIKKVAIKAASHVKHKCKQYEIGTRISVSQDGGNLVPRILVTPCQTSSRERKMCKKKKIEKYYHFIVFVN